MTCDHQWQESGTSKKHDWVCSKCKILYTVLKGLDDDDIQTYARPWQGLTDGEVLDVLVSVDKQTVRLPSMLGIFARAIEAKLKERNT
jgi:hypothetical protein